MENYFTMDMTIAQVNEISNLGLAHIGDGVYELLCRSYLCDKGGKKVNNLHKNAVKLVNAVTQAKVMDKLLPVLTEEEYENGRIAKVINKFLFELDEEKRRIFVRRYFYSDSVADIAERLRIGQPKVKTTLHRLRSELRDYLEGEGIFV